MTPGLCINFCINAHILLGIYLGAENFYFYIALHELFKVMELWMELIEDTLILGRLGSSSQETSDR